jgi:high-affinity Fe2+/Pb2+ permease
MRKYAVVQPLSIIVSLGMGTFIGAILARSPIPASRWAMGAGTAIAAVCLALLITYFFTRFKNRWHMTYIVSFILVMVAFIIGKIYVR